MSLKKYAALTLTPFLIYSCALSPQQKTTALDSTRQLASSQAEASLDTQESRSQNFEFATPNDRQSAVERAGSTSKVCQQIMPYYFEIGDQYGVQYSSSFSKALGKKINPNATMDIASASKWLFSTYALQTSNLTPELKNALNFKTGYSKFSPALCNSLQTAQTCFTIGANDNRPAVDIGKFHYGGGHMQYMAASGLVSGLASDRVADLIQKYNAILGLNVDFKSPAFSAAVSMSPSEYGYFLRKLMQNKYVLSRYLGRDPVCANKNNCAGTVNSSPVPYSNILTQSWDYSYGHWKESGSEDSNAVSSPGLYGFYPWISGDRQTYGLVARKDTNISAFARSVNCGQLLRQVWRNPKLKYN